MSCIIGGQDAQEGRCMACFREAKKRGRAGASAVGAGRMGIAIDRGPYNRQFSKKEIVMR